MNQSQLEFNNMADMPQVSGVDMARLNPPQREAVETTEGPLLVLAGAGTGKTRVLTTRIAHILAQNLAFPSQVLAVTFTNKAANEMRERVESMVGPDARSIWLGTFHSICLRILRRHVELAGLPKDFTIIDQDDQLRLIKQLIAENHVDEKRYPPKLVAAVIDRWKDRAQGPEQADGDEVLRRLYDLYQTRLKTIGAVDFGGLLLHCITLFKEHADVLAEYHCKFRYILVDEYQDTNVAQYLWLRLLAQAHHNICCVGDDDQSIYGWRGAEVENILRFEKDFDGAAVIRLEQNYRSTPQILASASGLIKHNKDRLGKTLFCDDEGGEKVRLVSVWDERAEAAYVGQEIEAQQQIHGATLDQMAVLVRAGFQTRSFEECFLKLGVPYRVIGGLRFYERMEIRDAIAYIRATVQPANDLALERIINLPRRGIGNATIDKMREFSRAMGVSLMEAMRQMSAQGAFKGKAGVALARLAEQFDHWRALAKSQPHVELVDTVLEESGYLEMWKQDKAPEAPGRVENLKELLTALGEFDDLAAFLEHVSLVMDGDDRPDEAKVSIMTMHGAKGLEFDTVFLTGWEEGLFPSQKALDEKGEAGLEEERRLAYVGMTRARRHLHITFAANRRVYGQWLSSIPSRFVDELPPEHVEVMNQGPGSRSQGAGHPGNNPLSPLGERVRVRGSSNTPLPTSPRRREEGLQAGEGSGFRKGERVFHQKFGYGRVLEISGDHLKIGFEKASVKTILAEYVKKAGVRG